MKASPTTAAVGCLLTVVSCYATAIVHNPSTSTTPRRSPLLVVRPDVLFSVRGGGDIDDEYDSDMSESESESSEPIVVVKKALSKSTVAAVKKSTKKATSKSKATVNASLKTSKPIQVKKKKKAVSRSIAQVLHIPYIVRACVNPLTLFAMTRAYFASLFNINYLANQDSSQGLRSALEAKAKRESAAGGGAPAKKKGKRAMKPGQAKSLSDLPALSA